MAVPDLDALFGKLCRLSSDELVQVAALVDELKPREATSRSPFQVFSGVLSAEDARLMGGAVEDCARIDLRGW
jgi:hypothetical protein